MADDTLAVLNAAKLPPVPAPDETATQLVMLAHRCIDWDVWGSARAVRYWDALASRVRAACYAGPTLAHWWARMCVSMSLHEPSLAADRTLLASLLAEGPGPVLDALRSRTEMIVVRVRVAVDHAKETR